MIARLLNIFIAVMLLSGSLSAFNKDSTGSVKVFFRENKGQVHDQKFKPRTDILFSGNAGGMVFHLKQAGLHYQLSRVDEWEEAEKEKEMPGNFDTEKMKVPAKSTFHRLDISWPGANPSAEIITTNPLPSFDNYYLPSCPNGATYVKSYQEITYKKIYDGIDLVFHNKNNELHYDFIVSPGADYTNIKIKIKGANHIKKNENGDVVIQTPLGNIVEGKPIVYQRGKQLEANWIIHKNQLSFFIPVYDPNYPLLIDPPVRNWGTYYGGVLFQTQTVTNTVDNFGNVFLLGSTHLSQNIATAGAFQTTIQGSSSSDRSYYIAKFNVNGIRLWGTYYGGSRREHSAKCTTDLNGNIYFCGRTNSDDIPTSLGAHQPNSANIWGYDAFLGKLNPNGIRLWATYYGGAGSETGTNCATDQFGNVYLTGTTTSTNLQFPNAMSTPGSHQPNTSQASNDNAYLVKFDSTGTRQWGTFYGGASDDFGLSCSTDSTGNIFIAGYAFSSTAISSPGSFQVSKNGAFGHSDMFIAKFNGAGTRLWGTYYGGSGGDALSSCKTDPNGNIFITGFSENPSLSTPGAYQTSIIGPVDMILAKFDGNGNRVWSTFFGGPNVDNVRSCTVNRFGDVFITGTATSLNMLSTPNAYQPNYNGGTNDAFLAKFDNNGNIYWSTYYGGTGSDHGYSCSTSKSGNIYLSGNTNSTSNIATGGSHQDTLGLISGVFAKDFLIQFCDTTPATPNEIFGPLTVCINNRQNVLFYVNTAGNNFIWSVPVGATIVSGQGTDSISVNFGTNGGNISVFAQNSCTSSATKIKTITINNVIPTPITSTLLSTICPGDSTVLSASGGSSYLWSTGDTGATITVSPLADSSYTVIVSNNGCDSLSQPINVIINPTYSFTDTVSICQGDSAFFHGQYQTIAGIYYDSLQTVSGCDSVYSTSLKVHQPKALINPSELSGLAPIEIFFGNGSTNANSYLWDFGTGDISNLISPSYTYTTAGNFVVTLTASDLNGCIDSTRVTLEINIKPIVSVPNTITPNNDGSNDFWIIDNIEQFPNHSIQVFNRNGSPVFKVNNYQNDWNGKRNGNELPATTYYYVIDLGNGDEILKGDLSIIREK